RRLKSSIAAAAPAMASRRAASALIMAPSATTSRSIDILESGIKSVWGYNQAADSRAADARARTVAGAGIAPPALQDYPWTRRFRNRIPVSPMVTRQQTLALAAVVQCCTLVQRMARTGST